MPNAILTYHSLDESGSVVSMAPSLFAAQMSLLAEQGIQVTPLEELLSPPPGTDLSRPRVAITFDDGFENVYEHAWPILQRYNFPATVFLVTDYCGHSNMWPGQPPHIPRSSLLRWSQVREMQAGGIDFGAHTCTHPNLTRLAARQIIRELSVSKQRLEETLGEPVITFAYPYGAHDPRVRDLAAQYFDVACTTDLGFVHADSHPLALARLDMYYLRHPTWLGRLFSAPMRAYVALRHTLRVSRRHLLSAART